MYVLFLMSENEISIYNLRLYFSLFKQLIESDVNYIVVIWKNGKRENFRLARDSDHDVVS